MNTNKPPVVIGLIYAKWCRYCKDLMPIWEKMSFNINHKSYHPRPQFMNIEQSNLGELERFNSENAEYLNNHRVQSNGFPTIFKIHNGKIEYYKDSRDPDSLEKWFMGNTPISKKKSKKHKNTGGRSNHRRISRSYKRTRKNKCK